MNIPLADNLLLPAHTSVLGVALAAFIAFLNASTPPPGAQKPASGGS
jgi:hypothetical protein